MKYSLLIAATILLSSSSFGKTKAESRRVKMHRPITETVGLHIADDKKAIRDLIRKVLNWKEQKSAFDLLPVITDKKNRFYTGFDLKILNANLKALQATGLFSKKFISNYQQIILTLDRKMRTKQIEPWQVGDLPTFSFANDDDPWCLCQDVPYDKPNAWSLVEIKLMNLNNDKGKLVWTWGELNRNKAPDWSDFKYQFEVEKEDGKWKISWMQGFDFKEATR